jgi:hypothetical protein
MNYLKTKIERRKPIRVAFEINNIRRVKTSDGIECRIVDGYAYCNAMVGDGWNLTRAAMQAATEDYNRWGAVREMHQASAVGNASGVVRVLNEQDEEEEIQLGVFWDANGATCRSLAVDPTAILKLDTKVYRAYSVGVTPTIMRGSDVIECKWIENSYVDRPADPDALITLIRAEGAGESVMDTETEVIQLVARSEFSEYLGKLRNWALDDVVSDACYMLMDCLWEAVRAGDGGDLGMAERSIDDFAAYLKEMMAAGGPGLARATTLLEIVRTRLSPETLTRFSALTGDLAAKETTLAAATQRAATAEAEIVRMKTEIGAHLARITELEAMPDPAQNLPFRGAERSLMPHVETNANPDIGKCKAELADAVKRAEDKTLPQAERTQLAVTISSLRQRLQSMGEAA